MAKAGRPGATCTCTSTARASIPSKATVETRWTMLPLAQSRVAEVDDSGKNNARTKARRRDPYRPVNGTKTLSFDYVSNASGYTQHIPTNVRYS